MGDTTKTKISESEIHLGGGLKQTTPEIINKLSEIARQALIDLSIENPDLSKVGRVEGEIDGSLYMSYMGNNGKKEIVIHIDPKTQERVAQTRGMTDILIG